MRGLSWIVCIACLGGCGAPVFMCLSSQDCGPGGLCSAGGFCTFPDSSCPSGLRYGEHAPDGLAGTCVVEEGDSGTSGPSDGTTTSTSGLPDPTTSSTTTPDATTNDATSSNTSSRVDDGTTGTSGSMDTNASTTSAEPVTVSFGERDDADFDEVTRDAFVSQWQPENNRGAHADFHVSGSSDTAHEVSLLYIDVSALPADAQVTAAELRLWPYDTVDDGTIEVHRVLEAWEEGTGDGSPGVCNWTQRLPRTLWTSVGVGPGSYDAALVAEFTAPDPFTEVVVPIPPETVEDMRDDPDGNHGFLLRSTAHTGTWFASKEESDATMRPLLVVTYVN